MPAIFWTVTGTLLAQLSPVCEIGFKHFWRVISERKSVSTFRCGDSHNACIG